MKFEFKVIREVVSQEVRTVLVEASSADEAWAMVAADEGESFLDTDEPIDARTKSVEMIYQQ